MAPHRALGPFVVSVLFCAGCVAPPVDDAPPATGDTASGDSDDPGAWAPAAAASPAPASSSAPPTLTAIAPTSGLPFTYVTVALTGTGFTPRSAVEAKDAAGGAVAVSNVVFHDATSMSATLFLAGGRQATANAISSLVVLNDAAPSQARSFATAPAVVVKYASDDAAGDPAGSGTGKEGELRHALANATSGDAIVFDTGTMCKAAACTIVLNGPLPPIQRDVSVDGAQRSRIVIDGQDRHRAFFIDRGTVTLAHLTIKSTAAVGGAGGGAYNVGASGAGGGLGAGASVFINDEAATVTIDDVAFDTAVARGGNGGAAGTHLDGIACGAGGGGGMSGKGGSAVFCVTDDLRPASGGGGGLLGAGQDSSADASGIGGLGGGGGGGASNMPPGLGGLPYAGNVAGALGGAFGGRGGFGGGGGGSAGNGGFGGGAGGVPATSFGGAAGAGGGTGGCAGAFWGETNPRVNAAPISGGVLVAAIHGGAGGGCGTGSWTANAGGGGGGGAAAGPAIFVVRGTLTIMNSVGSGAFVAAGGAGGAGAASGSYHGNAYGTAGFAGEPGTADSTPVFNYGGVINDSRTTGPIKGIL